MNYIKSFNIFYNSIINKLLVFNVLSMLLLGAYTTIMRHFNISYIWASPLLRHLVFLSAFLGGVVACSKGTHISIDILKKYLESKKMNGIVKHLNRFIMIVILLTLSWLFKISVDYTYVELEYGKIAFFGIHSAVLVGIIPFGVFLIAAQYLIQLILSFDKES